MRHKKAGYKLGRTTSHRRAMMRNMVTSLFEHERVVTTEIRAKAVKPLVEKMITLAKRGDLHARRQALSFITKKSITHKLFEEIKDRYMDRTGGYTSIVKVGPRRGDCAPMAVLELVKPEDRTKGIKKKGRKRGAKKKAAEGDVKKAQPEAKAPEATAEPEPQPQTETKAEESGEE